MVKDFTGMAVGFARVLRSAGVSVPIDRVTSFALALGVLGIGSREYVYQCAKATLISNPEDFSILDDCFAAWWLSSRKDDRGDIDEEKVTVAIETDDFPGDDSDDLVDEDEVFHPDITLSLRFSREQVLREKDFAKCSAAELEEAARAMDKISLVVPRRLSNRKIASVARRGPVDLRNSVRDALAHQGEPIRTRHLAKGTRPRRVVLLCDISGSMEPYARAMIRFLHSAVVGGVRVEAFTFSTQLTRITKELNWKDPDVALSRAGSVVQDWSGGTRIGEALHEFNEEYGIRGMARRAVVVIMSDGWDRGEPEVLTREMARLSRVTEKIVWVNPLKFTPGYAPVARGMAAALPFVSEFIEGHSLGSLETLAEVIAI